MRPWGEELAARGAVRLGGLIEAPDCDAMLGLFDALPADRPGARIDVALIDRLDPVVRVRRLVATLIGEAARPVRALLFDKTADNNWALGWHQDRTIEVAERREVAGFGPWTVKQGRLHVQPPFAVIEAMMTARFHLDAVDADNAPLRIAPGSNRLGLIREAEVEAVVAGCGEASCLAEKGDVWLYATPILHASSAATRIGHRRVLQIDFAAQPLPGGLAWAAAATR